LATRENELEEKNSELRTFFYRATHDLKGPSASIAGLVKLARREIFDTQVMQYLDKIEASATTLEGILLEFIRVIHIQEREIKPVPVDFGGIVNEILNPIRDSGKALGMEFKIEIACATEFNSDTGLINSILYNLLTNAVNYRKKQSDQPSYVHIKINHTLSGVNIDISDNGIGIPSEMQSKIFTIFFRGSENSKGSGLGLYIVKNAVKKLNGRIDLQSVLGKGTTFHIFLPSLTAANGNAVQEPIPLIA
jgi:signal transduction histidine kinase